MTDSTPIPSYKQGDLVRSDRFGRGHVEFDKGATVLVRFEAGIQECAKAGLIPIRSALDAIAGGTWHTPLEVVARVQAEAIRSINDAWGVFARSQIALLPHQLWVCRKVLERWPARWLVADDVGLGKTIEAGLILTPLRSSGRVRRLLILCPASLVEQWQDRLRTMFDIRLPRYTTEADGARADFWGTHPEVIASIETLRLDNDDRHQRLSEAPPWDLVIVDEAHRLGDDEQSGPTLAHRLIQRLDTDGKVVSIVFFTGTPHRGKDHAFLSLLRLLRPDRFDPKRPLEEQLDLLRDVVIRNNKQVVTDLRGVRLFKDVRVTPRTYRYSPAEACFYDTLTEFIVSGKAYAGRQSTSEGQVIMLVLIALQKLASSSVAAVARAIRGRLSRIADARSALAQLRRQRESLLDLGRLDEDWDELSKLEERIGEIADTLHLVEDEEERLRELVALAGSVTEETKIHEILGMLDGDLAGRSVLFFTEYKATQALLATALIARFGVECVTFINGEGRLEGVTGRPGSSWVESRARAADLFNAGEVRFLISTEAGGEGIDLQERCHTLIHVDLPWNPMRLHQRVGRLHRYGQTKSVDVFTFRNPDTVEGRIWQLLNDKIQRIQTAMTEVMDDPEDMYQLVLGMAPSSLFRNVFAGASAVRPDALGSWFDAQTARFGGRDAIDTVKSIVGHFARFNFQEVSDRIPKVDLPALRPLLVNVLTALHRRPKESDGTLGFTTPEAWRSEPGFRRSYDGLSFDRNNRAAARDGRLVGVGFRIFDLALDTALQFDVAVASLPSPTDGATPLVVFKVIDRITGSTSPVRAVVAGVAVGTGSPTVLLRDWEVLERLNQSSSTRLARGSRAPTATAEQVRAVIEVSRPLIDGSLAALDIRFDLPEIQLLAVLWPAPVDDTASSSADARRQDFSGA